MATKKAPMREDQRRVHEAAVPMGRMMIQYQRELSRCEEVFAAQLRPLETEVFDDYHEIYWKEKAIEWNNMLLAKMAERKDSFSERIDMAQERDAWLQAAQRRFVDGCSALKTVTSADLAVLRKQVNPSPMIKTCTEAVLELNGEMDTDWEAAQVILADSYFLNFFVPRACRYDIKQVSDEILQNLDDNVKNPDFQYERVMKLSTPCAAFVKWARAIYDYAMIDRIVKVKGLEMADLEAENKKAQQEIDRRKFEIKDDEDKIANLVKDREEAKAALKNRFDSNLEPLQQDFFEKHHMYETNLTCMGRR